MADYIITAVAFAGIFAIAGSGLYVLTGLTGQVSLAQGAYVAIGASVSSYLARTASETTDFLGGRGLVFAGALAIAALITGLVSALFGFLTVRLKGASAISASIAASVIVLYLIERAQFLSGGSRGAKAPQILNVGNLNFADLKIAGYQFDRETGIMILVIIISLVVFWYIRNVSRSPLARSMRTIRERDLAAQTCAVSPTKTIVSAHFICGLCAGIAGALYAPVLETFEISSSNPWLGVFGIIASMQILAFVVVGGMKKYWLTVLVVFALAFLSSFLSEFSSTVAWLDSAQGGRISPSQITAIVSSLIVISIIQTRAQFLKKQL